VVQDYRNLMIDLDEELFLEHSKTICAQFANYFIEGRGAPSLITQVFMFGKGTMG
jgi:hypothetical protein